MNGETRVNRENRPLNIGTEKHKMSLSEDKAGIVFQEGPWSHAAQVLSGVKIWHIGVDRMFILIFCC